MGSWYSRRFKRVFRKSLMLLISHRGNINGRKSEYENKPSYIVQAIESGYQCEVDVWFVGGKFMLGHDEPTYEFPFELIEKYFNKLWLHCKDIASLSKFNQIDRIGSYFNYFSHDKDIGVLTSKGYIWSTNVYDGGILVMPEVFNKQPSELTTGVCSDNISKYNG